jgi:hypothetical protein
MLSETKLPSVRQFLFLWTVATASTASAGEDRLTICHVATDDDDSTESTTLPTARARKHLAQHPGDFSGTCDGSDFVMVAVSGTLEEGFPE